MRKGPQASWLCPATSTRPFFCDGRMTAWTANHPVHIMPRMTRFVVLSLSFLTLITFGCGSDKKGTKPDAGVDRQGQADTRTDSATTPDDGPSADTQPNRDTQAAGEVASDRPADTATNDARDAAASDRGQADTQPDMSMATDAASSSLTVKVRGETLSFMPELLKVKVGDTVTWVWEANGHSVRSGGSGGTLATDCQADGKFQSGTKNTGDTFTHTFTAVGNYGYHCAVHCMQFEGGLVVVE